MLEQVKSGKCPVPGEEQAETRCGELTTAPIAIPLLCCEGTSRECWSESETGKEEKSAGEGVAKLSFSFSSSYSGFIGNQLISPSSVTGQ